MREEAPCIGLLDQFAAIHHGDFIGVAGHHAEVVSDQHQRHVAVASLFTEKIEDLCLHGHVERGGGLVGEQCGGATSDSDGDHHTLTHTARHLVRVLLETPFGLGDTNVSEQLLGRRPCILLGHTEVDLEWLRDLFANLHHRIQRRHRILEDHRHLFAPHSTHGLAIEIADFTTFERDAATSHRASRGE